MNESELDRARMNLTTLYHSGLLPKENFYKYMREIDKVAWHRKEGYYYDTKTFKELYEGAFTNTVPTPQQDNSLDKLIQDTMASILKPLKAPLDTSILAIQGAKFDMTIIDDHVAPNAIGAMWETKFDWAEVGTEKQVNGSSFSLASEQHVFDKLGVSWSCPHVVAWRDDPGANGSYLAHGDDPNHEIFFSRVSLVKMSKRERATAIRGWLEQCCGKDPQLPLSLLPPTT